MLEALDAGLSCSHCCRTPGNFTLEACTCAANSCQNAYSERSWRGACEPRQPPPAAAFPCVLSDAGRRAQGPTWMLQAKKNSRKKKKKCQLRVCCTAGLERMHRGGLSSCPRKKHMFSPPPRPFPPARWYVQSVPRPPTLCRRLWLLHERAGRRLAGTWGVRRASARKSARGGAVPSHSSAISIGCCKRDHAKARGAATANMPAQRWLLACRAAAHAAEEVRQLGAKTAKWQAPTRSGRQELWVSGSALTPPGVCYGLARDTVSANACGPVPSDTADEGRVDCHLHTLPQGQSTSTFMSRKKSWLRHAPHLPGISGQRPVPKVHRADPKRLPQGKRPSGLPTDRGSPTSALP